MFETVCVHWFEGRILVYVLLLVCLFVYTRWSWFIAFTLAEVCWVTCIHVWKCECVRVCMCVWLLWCYLTLGLLFFLSVPLSVFRIFSLFRSLSLYFNFFSFDIVLLLFSYPNDCECECKYCCGVWEQNFWICTGTDDYLVWKKKKRNFHNEWRKSFLIVCVCVCVWLSAWQTLAGR